MAAWECLSLSVDEHVLGANLQLSANRRTRWWQRCLLHLLSFALSSTRLTNVHVLLRQRRVFLLVPHFFFLFRLHLVTADSVDTFRLSDIAQECSRAM